MGFRAAYERDVAAGLRRQAPQAGPVTEADIAHLPPVVQRYLHFVGSVRRSTASRQGRGSLARRRTRICLCPFRHSRRRVQRGRGLTGGFAESAQVQPRHRHAHRLKGDHEGHGSRRLGGIVTLSEDLIDGDARCLDRACRRSPRRFVGSCRPARPCVADAIRCWAGKALGALLRHHRSLSGQATKRRRRAGDGCRTGTTLLSSTKHLEREAAIAGSATHGHPRPGGEPPVGPARRPVLVLLGAKSHRLAGPGGTALRRVGEGGASSQQTDPHLEWAAPSALHVDDPGGVLT